MSSISNSLSDDTTTFAARLRVTLLFIVAISSVGMRRGDKVQYKQSDNKNNKNYIYTICTKRTFAD